MSSSPTTFTEPIVDETLLGTAIDWIVAFPDGKVYLKRLSSIPHPDSAIPMSLLPAQVLGLFLDESALA